MGEWGMNGSVLQRQVSPSLGCHFPNVLPSHQTPFRELLAPMEQKGSLLSYKCLPSHMACVLWSYI